MSRRARLSLGGTVLAVVGMFVLRTAGGGTDGVPEVGVLGPIMVPPAERIDTRELALGETFGEILFAASLDSNEQRDLLAAFAEQASPRRMRPGTQISLRWASQAEPALRGIDVQLNKDRKVRLTRDSFGWISSLVETPTIIDTVYVAGEIESVLWTSVVDHEGLQDLPLEDRALLIHRLDQVYQWQIDFSRQIRQGDSYRFAFEREVRPDGSMRSGHLLSAELVNQGRSFTALWFDPNGDGQGTYYDLDGNSVRRAFLTKPLEFRRISSRFSGSRLHPTLNVRRAHRGIDYAADSGTPIMATGDGVVVHRGPRGGLGNAVIVQHVNRFETRYGHMRSFAPGVRVGSRVKQGDVIGYVGMTGQATGPHLHYEMIRGGAHVDPLGIELPAGDPVPSASQARWDSEIGPRFALLDLATRVQALRRRTEVDPDGP